MAFAFYYRDNLEALAELGVELVEFSPLADDALPDHVDGIYLGGGYPELFASELSANSSMRESVGEAARRRVPIYAECGGMLYLMESLTDLQGRGHEMVGALRARARMTGKLQRLGYVEAELADDCVLGERGVRVRGHEFRYSYCEPAAGQQPAWLVGGEAHGFSSDSIVASYLHLNFAGCPEIARDFVAACGCYRTERTI
jgi:cobyrinic acid a,c-diamide synthase